jgi:hypothetical protein
MVQEKDAAIKRVQVRRDFLRGEREKLDANTIKFRWYVVEHTPGYNTGGYYDQDIPAKSVKVSDYFDTEDQAQSWMDRHEPDKGKELIVKRHRLLKRSFTEWVVY